MKFLSKLIVNLKTQDALDKVSKAADEGLLDTLVLLANTVIKESPYLTGHNARSIAYKLGTKVVKTGTEEPGEKQFFSGSPTIIKNQAAIYSTSGYGGVLETGGKGRAPRPYFQKALDMHGKKLGKNIKAHME